MYVVIYKGTGKRIKHSRNYRHLSLYGQKFAYNKKAILEDDFVKEAGLDNEKTFKAVSLSLKTDYGIYIVKDTGGNFVEKVIKGVIQSSEEKFESKNKKAKEVVFSPEKLEL